MTKAQLTAQRLIKKHGSLRKAERATGIPYSLLQKIAKGTHSNLTVRTLERLGIQT